MRYAEERKADDERFETQTAIERAQLTADQARRDADDARREACQQKRGYPCF